MKNVIIAVIILLSGCANTSDPAKVAQATETVFDPYSKQTSVLGDMVKEGNILAGDILFFRLEAKTKVGAEPVLRLYVGSTSDKWGFLYTASDIDAITLPVLQISSEMAPNAAAAENVAVALSRPYLESHKSSGMNIRIAGNHGAITVKVPGPYIDGYLAKLDDTKTRTDKCGGQVSSDAKTGFFASLFHSKADDSKLPDTECSR